MAGQKNGFKVRKYYKREYYIKIVFQKKELQKRELQKKELQKKNTKERTALIHKYHKYINAKKKGRSREP